MGTKKKSDDSKKKKKQDNPESKLEANLTTVENERTNLNVHISFLKQKLTDAQSERSANLRTMKTAQDFAKQIEDNYIDILSHRERLMKTNEQTINDLEREVDRLKSEVVWRDDSISKLEETNRKNIETLAECDSLLDDKQKLDHLVKAQSSVVERQSKEIDELIDRKQRLESEIEDRDREVESLRLKAEDKAELKIIFDEICFVKRKHRLTLGEAPVDRSASTITTSSDGTKVLVVGGDQGSSLAVLDVSSLTWTSHELPNQPFRSLCGHSTSSMSRSKIITCGGVRNGVPSSNAMILNTETMKWQSLDLSRMVSPAARSNHASCACRDRLFVFGGIVDEEFSDQLWMLDLESLEWKHLVGYGESPSPRSGSTISISEDGRKLYLFGGFDGSETVNDFYVFDIEKQMWNLTNTLNAPPQGRQFHTSSLIGHSLLIAGGMRKSNDGSSTLGDVHILDLVSLHWGVLDDGSWVSNYPWMKPDGRYMTLNGSQLMILKPDRHEQLSQITMYEVTLPDEITLLKSQKKKESTIRTMLEFVDAVCLANSIEVHWMPPTKNAERIEHYKLMMATLSGTVKDVYQGKKQSHRLTGLRPNTEYILCIKATYDDGSHVWSDSQSFKTKSASKNAFN